LQDRCRRPARRPADRLVPVGVGGIGGSRRLQLRPWLPRCSVAVGLGALVAGLGWQRRALSVDGAVAAATVGASTFAFGGLRASLSLIGFFVTGSALSRRGSMPGEIEGAKGHRRDAVQVLANGGIAAGALALGAAGWSGGAARHSARWPPQPAIPGPARSAYGRPRRLVPSSRAAPCRRVLRVA